MYILPLIILFATYVPITVKLWSDRGLGEVTRAQVEGIKSKRRVVKMLIAVMVIFAICWLPYQLFFLTLHAPIDQGNPSLPVIFICCYGLAMSNSMYNPIIYCIMNRRFRDGFLNAIGCCPFVKHYRQKYQRTRFHRNFQTIVSCSEMEHDALDRQISRHFHKKGSLTNRPSVSETI
uniref:G_PROTEIN_RECEP_F1_2 domain-containing protein n=1 Tax=Mesocestoides corti TaxID=53468 RepID=A0A5K3FUM5_MESCO